MTDYDKQIAIYKGIWIAVGIALIFILGFTLGILTAAYII